MSRPLLGLALALFVLFALAPIGAMALRIEGADWARMLEPRALVLLGRTALLGLGAAALALVLGVPFGYAVARTDAPFARWLRSLSTLPILIPPLFLAMTWTVLVDWRGYAASVWVLGLSGFPLVAAFAARAAERVDQRLLDAAKVAGGPLLALRVDLRMVLPPALSGAALAFVFAANDFAVPNYVSFVGSKFNVYADEIFSSWNQTALPGLAVVKSLPLIALNLLALVPALVLRRSGSLATLASGFQAPEPWKLGFARVPVGIALALVIAAAAVVPLGRLFYEAGGGPRLFTDRGVRAVLENQPLTAPSGLRVRPADQGGSAVTLEPSAEATGKERLLAAPGLLLRWAENARAGLREGLDRARADLLRSYRYAATSAALVVLLGLILGHAIERTRRRPLGRALELSALVPLAAPATLFGIGAIAMWARPQTQELYQGEWMPTLLFSGRLLAFGVLIFSGAVASMDRSLEEAAQVAGVRPARRLFRVVAPNLLGTLAGSFALVFAFAMRELDSAILVPAANRTAIVRVYNGVHFGRDDFVAALALVLVLSVLLPGLLWSAFARRPMEILK